MKGEPYPQELRKSSVFKRLSHMCLAAADQGLHCFIIGISIQNKMEVKTKNYQTLEIGNGLIQEWKMSLDK